MKMNNTLSFCGDHTMRNGVVRAHKSWLFLVLVIGSSLMQILSVFSDCDWLSSVVDILSFVGNVFETKTLSIFENVLRIVQLLYIVSGVLIVVCMWELFVRSRNNTGEMLNVARYMPAFHMVNSVIMWIQLFIPLGLVWLAIYRLGGPSDHNQTAHQVLFWVVVVFSVVDAVIIHYHLGIFTVIRIVTAQIAGKNCGLNIPALVIVENIVVGLCGIILSLIWGSELRDFVGPVVYLVAGGMMMKVRWGIKKSKEF